MTPHRAPNPAGHTEDDYPGTQSRCYQHQWQDDGRCSLCYESMHLLARTDHCMKAER